MNDLALVLTARRLRAARGVVVARDVSVTASPGDVVAVEGPNGSGKSTLLAAAAGLLPVGSDSVRPGSVGYAPERAGVLPRVPLHRWLIGLARTSGLPRDESARCAGDLLLRLGLAHASQVPLQALARGNAQRALVAQALVGDPDLLVLVARHPTAPLPLPPGVTWRLRDGAVDTVPRSEPTQAELAPAGTMVVETGDGVVRLVDEAALPDALRAALDAGLGIRRVSPPRPLVPDMDVAVGTSAEAAAPGCRAVRGRPRLAAGSHRAIRLAADRRGGRLPRAVHRPGHPVHTAAEAEHARHDAAHVDRRAGRLALHPRRDPGGRGRDPGYPPGLTHV